MTAIYSPNKAIYEQLIDKHGMCLSCDILVSRNFMSEYFDLKRDNKFGQITSKMSPFVLERMDIALFEDGTLYHEWNINDDMLKRFVKIVENKGYKVTSIKKTNDLLGSGYSSIFMENVSRICTEKTDPKQDLEVQSLPSIKEFLQKVFSGNNICITASKFEKIAPQCRDYLALFDDGHFFVSEKYDRYNNIYDNRKISKFRKQYPQYVYFKAEVIPQEYLDAIYQKAKEYDWYISPEDANLYNHSTGEFSSDEEKIKMNRYIADLLNQKSKCLSLIWFSDLEGKYYDGKYILFENGCLLIDDEYKKSIMASDLKNDLSRYFYNMEFRTEFVPAHYIEEIYNQLPNYQNGALKAYMEMLKQKARKLKKMLDIPHYEALDLAAQITGWKNWKEVISIDENRARYVMNVEKYNKRTAESFGQEQVQTEYNTYLKNQK
ncbi:MAG: hypothetical protein IJZ59_08050 [Alphaproteobacteria bacterium]|nr:hypothetical protein [Alphaproteobacteria bacterium]